jgi:hypothetical protein
MMVAPQGQQQFDPSQYPHIKPTRPHNNKTLRMCPVCKKLGYIYLLDKNGTKFIYYIHYNEPPIGLTILKGKPIGFRYRRCTKGGKTYSTMEEALAEAEEENSRAQVKQHRRRQIQHEGLVFVPRGKRLTICTKCNKPGYMYTTYFQHYNEPPIGKVILKGKVIGDKYRRCYLAKENVKQDQDNIKRKANSVQVQKEKEKSSKDIILKKLGRYIEESGSNLFREDDTGTDYKKMYWDLIDNLKNIVDNADGI